MTLSVRRSGSRLVALVAALTVALLVLAIAPARADLPGYRQMKNRDIPWLTNGVCLDIDQGKYAAGTQAGLEWCDQDTAQQQWKAINVTAAYPYTQIVVHHTGMCLTVRNGQFADWTAVEQRPCVIDNPNTPYNEIPEYQQWKWVHVSGGPGYLEVIARHSSKCLTNNNWNAWQVNCNGSTRQHWTTAG
jgi:hypothetical protein